MRFLIEDSSALAASDISSSEIMLTVMRSSSDLSGCSPSKNSAREFSMPSHWLYHEASAAVSRSTSAVSSSSLNDSILPDFARLMLPEMSFILRNLGVPNLDESVNASSVRESSVRTLSMSFCGFSLSARSRQTSLHVCSARSSSILSSSSFL